MRTQNTTLCLVNFSGKTIAKTDVAVDDKDNWDPRSQPDENFTGPLDTWSSRCVRQEINKGTNNGCWFRITVTFTDGSTLSFRANQWDVWTKSLIAPYTEALQVSVQNWDLRVFRRTGQDRYTYTNAFYICSPVDPDNARWMGELLSRKPTIKLNEITMPGSHDAGMYLGTNEQAKTQTLSIGDQIKAGARYFDLRVCKTVRGELWTYHGSTYGGKLDDILDDVGRFFAAGTAEVVFLKFRSNAGSDQQDTVDLVKSKLNSYLYKAASAPNFATQTLSSLQARVVAVFHPDYPDSMLNPSDGTLRYSDYGNENTGSFIPHSNNQRLGVYDAYAHRSEFDLMQKDQLDKWSQHGGYGKDYLFLLSWTLTGSTDNVLDLDLLSATANPQLPKQLHALRANAAQKGLPNIVYIDQIDP